MLKGMLASNASKMVAACVCPVAGTVALTVGSPQVRQAVHRATAPRAYALPKTRIRQPAAVATPGAAPLERLAMATPPCAPSIEPGAPLTADFVPGDLTELASIGDLPNNPGLPPQIGSILPDGGLIMPGIPEPRTWMQMLIGFGIIGGAARYSLRHNRVDLAETTRI